MGKKRAAPEELIQRAIVNHLLFLENQGKLTFTAITNNVPRGGLAAMKSQMKFKTLGLRPGFPDIAVALPAKPEYGQPNIYIEVKAPKGRQVDTQKDWQAKLEAQGHIYRICRSVDDVKDLLKDWI